MQMPHQTKLPVPLIVVVSVFLITVLMPVVVPGAIPAKDDWQEVTVIDMHTHLFNARDLPLAGVLNAQRVFGIRVPRNVAERAARVLNDSTPEDEGEPKRDVSKQEIEQAERPTIRELAEREREILLDYVGKETRPTLAGAAEHLGVSPDVTLMAATIAKIGFPPGEGLVRHYLVPKLIKPLELGEKLRGYVRFVGIMTRRHDVIVAVLKSNYPRADLFVHHMMDMEVGYFDKPKVPFADQVVRMQKLDQAFPGQLLHFTAFDPFRRRDALSSVQRAVNDYSAIGLKIYPPSGYRATENATYKFPPLETGADRWEKDRWTSRYGGWTENELDNTLQGAFGWAAAPSGVPLFTHCTPTGFEAVPAHGNAPGYGMMADPFFWASALRKTENKNLRLCFGHSGGEAYWFSDPVNDAANEKNKPPGHPWQFGNQVVKLCLKYPDVYCEVGYLNEIFKPQQAEALVRRLKAVVDLPSDDGKWRFGDKLMYGTDWHMMYKEPHYEKYLEKWDEIIKQVDKGSLRQAFFAGNAKKFLRLDELAKDGRFTPEQQKQLAALSAGIK
jgi:predicted TIM-barrel fold metal-dependent hydrolase